MKRNLWIFLLSFFCVGMAFFSTFYTLSATASEVRSFTIVLDAGHGGIDCGVLGTKTGIKESDVNLSIVKKIKSALKDTSLKVVLTRETEAGLYGVVGKGMKKRDMAKRQSIIEKSNPVAVVSIHQNSYPQNTSRCGSQVFYRDDSESGKLLASALQKSLNISNPFRKDLSVHTGDYFILNCTSFPSVIVECGFLTNQEEELLLSTQDYQEVIANSVVQGILSFLAVQTGK